MKSIRKSGSLFPVFLTYFLDNFGLAVIYPIFTPLIQGPQHPFFPDGSTYLERSLILGLLIAAFPLAQFFGAPLIGQFSDRFGRKRSFFITILGSALGYFLTAASIYSLSLPLLFISRFFTGLFAGNLTLCLAAIADMSKSEELRTKNFGQIGAIGGLSFILAIAFGGYLSDPTHNTHFNPSVPFLITGVLSLINLLSVTLLFHETHPSRVPLGVHPFKGMHNLFLALKKKELRPIYLVNFFFMSAWISSMQFFPSFVSAHFQFTTARLSLAMIGVGALWSITNLLVNRLLAHYFHPGKTLLVCLSILTLLLSSTFFTHTPLPFFLLFYPAVAVASLCWTNGLATISLKAPRDIQGSILGINQSMTSIASMFSPILGGALIGVSKHAVYDLAAITCLIAVCILCTHRNRF
ncbi:MAG: MFS transporter [Verrucomicrobia bacterium]|nr:MFS transporter [Verrucomicrobiota bacterium]